MPECLICCEDKQTMVVGHCNHPFTCLTCAFKLRSLNKNTKCIFCNEDLPTVLLTSNPDTPFTDLEALGPTFYTHGIGYTDPEERWECYNLDSIRCPIKKCRQKTRFKSMVVYQKHLEKEHNRYHCHLCLKHRKLVLKEQKIYRKGELDLHLRSGDFDEDENRVFRHPFCSFCKKEFYDEEAFLSHLKKEHFKCHLCRPGVARYRYYGAYKNLDTHFKMSHYSCPEEVCKEKCFIAFRTRGELDKHMTSVHKKEGNQTTHVLLRDNGVDDTIKDNEGVDISDMLMSVGKEEKKRTDEEITEDLRRFKGPVDKLDLFEHLVTTPMGTVEEERDLVFDHNKHRNKKDYHEIDVYLEDVRFAKITDNRGHGFSEFVDRAKLILDHKGEKQLRQLLNQYNRTRMSAGKAFDGFFDIFGPYLVYKYSHHFCATIENTSKARDLNAFVRKELNVLLFQKKNLLGQTKTWKDFFENITNELARSVFRRLERGKVKVTDRFRMNSSRLKQLLGCVKTLSLQDLIGFKFLSNFLRVMDSRKDLQTGLAAPIKKAEGLFDRIDTGDVLVMFLYFNLAVLKFEGKTLTKAVKLNPNLLKQFLRHYPKVAEDFKYKLGSDDEDYEEKNTSNQTSSSKIINNTKKDKKGKKDKKKDEEDKKPTNSYKDLTKKDVLLVKANDHLDIDNKFDFPSLSEQKKKQKESSKEENNSKTKIKPNSGWGFNSTLVYSNKATKRKAMEEEFPDLESANKEESNKFMNNMFKKKEKSHLEKRFEKKEEVNEGGRDLRKELRAKATGGGIVPIKKKKKKKKRGF